MCLEQPVKSETSDDDRWKTEPRGRVAVGERKVIHENVRTSSFLQVILRNSLASEVYNVLVMPDVAPLYQPVSANAR